MATAAELSYAEVASSVFKLFQSVGPFSLGDIAFGLNALARKHREQNLTYDIQVSQ